MDLISIVIPVYNVEKYIEKCVASFLKQTYSNIEILLVDDGSTDSSGDICDRIAKDDPRIRVIHKKNGGLSDARNVGIEHASGNLITFFDSDDYVDDEYIEYLLSLKQKYNAQLSSCAYKIVSENGKECFASLGEKEEALSKEEFLKRMLNEEGVTVSACFKLYDKKLFNGVRYPVGKICEDNGTTYKIIDNVEGKIAFGNEAKGYYVMRSESIMRSTFSAKKFDMIELTDEMCDYLDDKYPNLHEYVLRRRIYARFNVLRQMRLKNKEFRKEMDEIIAYILKNKKFIRRSKVVPRRDKIALFLLNISTRLFFFSWKVYRKIKYV